ncbi:MAG: hypothetical protein GXP55_23335 [Deltaproteobacteria bacterium]|nr:hypothetical protein [Deltaproteobacteria bacterium]
MNSQTRPERDTNALEPEDTLPRFASPPPQHSEQFHGFGAPTRWLRLGLLLLLGVLVLHVAKQLMRGPLVPQLAGLADAFGNMPALEWLPATLILAACMLSASVGLRDPKAKAAGLLPLLGLAALPLVFTLLLNYWR